jgi:hypothetical protein
MEQQSFPPSGTLEMILDHFNVTGPFDNSSVQPVDELLTARVMAGLATDSERAKFRENLIHSARWRKDLSEYVAEETEHHLFLSESSNDTDVRNEINQHRQFLVCALENNEEFDPFWSLIDETGCRNLPGGPPFDTRALVRAYGERPCSLSGQQMLLIASFVNQYQEWRKNFDILKKSEDQAIQQNEVPLASQREYRRELRHSWVNDADQRVHGDSYWLSESQGS